MLDYLCEMRFDFFGLLRSRCACVLGVLESLWLILYMGAPSCLALAVHKTRICAAAVDAV